MKDDPARSPSDLKKLLAMTPSSKQPWPLPPWWAVVALALLIGLAFFKWGLNRDSAAIRYETVEAQQGDLTVIVSATGNLQPTEQVEVGSEVSGTIARVEVDYNDAVKAGQVLARLDTTKLAAQANQSRAAVEAAKASLLQIQAGLEEAGRDLDRLRQVRQLSGGKIPSGQEMEAAEAALKRAQADEIAGRARIAEAEARLRVDQTNLDKAIILSPINGVVLARSVDPGQTVAASLQAPVLFTLAEDLSKMELHVAVDEADVGQVREGQEATFTVDAYPDRVFPARITLVRYGSQSVEGVVTYLTVLNVNNDDLSLRPGMTATADIVVKELKNALLVPNAALRFSPAPEATSTANTGGSLLSKLFPRPMRSSPQKGKKNGAQKEQTVWTLSNNQPRPVSITIGATSGTMSEVTGGELSPGTTLIVEATGKGR